jgi:hypothetical protein
VSKAQQGMIEKILHKETNPYSLDINTLLCNVPHLDAPHLQRQVDNIELLSKDCKDKDSKDKDNKDKDSKDKDSVDLVALLKLWTLCLHSLLAHLESGECIL